MINISQGKDILFIITPDQFGYHTDDYYRAFYARKDYDVYIICYDHGKEKVQLSDVNVHYVKFGRERIKNEINMHRAVKKHLNNMEVKTIYTRFFITCAFLRLFNIRIKSKWILDIRTGAVSGSNIRRLLYNGLVRLSARFYSKVTIISESLANELKLNKYSVVPLGGQPLIHINEIKDSIEEMNFLYVGIFDGRRVDDIVNAYCKFYKEHSYIIKSKLTIIGYSINKNEEKRIINIINENPNIPISYMGRIPNMKLKKYFIDSNIGISYIPITPWFDVQPPTKTFEYIVNGMVCIATDTTENSRVITENNGIIVKDNEESLFQGMVKILKLRGKYNRSLIVKESNRYTWESVYSILRNIIN